MGRLEAEAIRGWLLRMPPVTLTFVEGTPAMRNVADSVNALVHDCIVHYAQAGWLPTWRVEYPPDYVEVWYDYDMPLADSYAVWAKRYETYPSVHLGMHRRTATSVAVQWVLAHELTHCYLYPTVRQATAAKKEMHDTRSWELFADEVANRVVPGCSRAMVERQLRKG